ncbi:hypothetical protein [Burkholderia territorii]|uniref:hypothetical protein n=1 Tax=Burkholderia territorii TaxID=1503055 RepID=UPI000AA07EF0|nr:hypothetical protein [Burkholderia territorii]
MKFLKLENFIRDGGWRGACARMLGIFLVYIGFIYIPTVVSFLSANFGVLGMSGGQIKKHDSILYVVRVGTVLMVVVEIVRLIMVTIKNRR